MGVLDRVRSIFSAKDSSLEDIEAALADAQRENAAAGAEVERLASLRHDLLVRGSDDEVERHDQEAAAAARMRDRAAALAEELESKLAAAQRSAEQAQRLGLRREAEDATANLAAMPQQLEAIYDGLRSVLREIAEAQLTVQRSNEQLPDGVAPLPDPELAVRSIPGLEREVVSEEIVELWTYSDGRPLPDKLQGKVREHNGQGILPVEPGVRATKFDVVRKKCVRITSLPATLGRRPASFARELKLPAWRADDPAGWTPLETANPSAILARLHELENAEPIELPKRQPSVELVALDVHQRRQAGLRGSK